MLGAYNPRQRGGGARRAVMAQLLHKLTQIGAGYMTSRQIHKDISRSRGAGSTGFKTRSGPYRWKSGTYRSRPSKGRAGYRRYTKAYPSKGRGKTNYGFNTSKNARTAGKKGLTGKLVIPRNIRKTSMYNKAYPRQLFQKYFLTPSENLDSNGILRYPQDMLVSTPSLDSKHMSCVVMNLGCAENHLDSTKYKCTEKNLVPTGSTYIGANTILWENNTDNTALESKVIPYQINKFPTTAFPANIVGTPTFTTEYKTPNTVINGINLNFVFKSAGTPFDQILSIKLVRCTLPEAIGAGAWHTINQTVPTEVVQRELCNRGQFTNRVAFQTLWTQSVKLPAVRSGSKKIPTIRVKKFVKCQYLRSQMRRVGTASNEATLGAQTLPRWTYEDGFFNNLYVVITSKSVDDQYVTQVEQTITGSSPASVEVKSALRSVPGVPLVADGYASDINGCCFRYGGTLTIHRRAKAVDLGLGQSTVNTMNSLQDQINELQQIIGEHQDDDSDCPSCEEVSDSESDCGSGHQAGASPPSDGHTHPNNLTAEEHDNQCQHSH